MTTRPRLLDLFCGAGGAAMGYYRAGFDVTGVDIKPQPHYPFPFILGDALEYVREHGREYDAIHASPPCQAYSTLRHMRGAGQYPDMISSVRSAISNFSYVIENVPTAPLLSPAILCASALGVKLPDGARLQRHRAFESSVFIWSTQCVHFGQVLGVYGDIRRNRRSGMLRGMKASWEEAKTLMGIDWMTHDELTEAIPPAYTEWVGKQLLLVVEANRR